MVRPIADHGSFDGRRVGALGRAHRHPADEPSFDYLDFALTASVISKPRRRGAHDARSSDWRAVTAVACREAGQSVGCSSRPLGR